MLKNNILAASGSQDEKLYSDDVFQSFTRTGTGADVIVTTGIDMTKGYMLWSKGRSGSTDHAVYDSVRGPTFDLASNINTAQTTQATGLKSVSATGHTIGSLAKMNTSAATYVDFVFRKAPKFLDVVTWTGNATNRTIAHILGQEVGLIYVKRTDTTADWQVYHRSLANTEYMILNSTAAKGTGATRWNSTTPTTSVLSLGTDASVNASGGTYVAYIFAHDTSADGMIQCGSYTGNGSATGPVVTLGWEPQYLLIKNASGTGNWQIIDNIRGMLIGSNDASLQANLSNVESSVDYFSPLATGFQVTSSSTEVNTNGSSYVYMAICRPNKPPTSGTQVYNAIARTGTGAAATVTGVGFAPDLVAIKQRSSAQLSNWTDRLRGKTQALITSATTAETAYVNDVTGLDSMDGVTLGTGASGNTNTSAATYINHFFRRAPGFFDVVCYTGNDVARTVSHSLDAIPEFMIMKSRSAEQSWKVYAAPLGTDKNLELQSTNTVATNTATWNNTAPTESVFSLGAAIPNFSSNNYICYLFASLPGISKVGSYTGNGGSLSINCGFTTGARFVLIKRTDVAGDWYVWDSVRGIVAANDPHLSLNTTASEVTTDDSVDPFSAGFSVNQLAATNINVTSASYIYLAIA